jgi:hypothetical protein
MNGFERNEILPEDPELEPLHDREYRVRAFRKDPNLLVRGSVRDQKPANLYFGDDPNPITVHHMQVDLELSLPNLEIVAVKVHFEEYPNLECPQIVENYDGLIGLSVARGFTHSVRELFGGPRGCSHTTALLQAMAPVAVQCFWSLAASNYQRRRLGGGEPAVLTHEGAAQAWKRNVNTCHIWDETGPTVENIRNGGPRSTMVFVAKRLADLNRDENDPRNAIRVG